jgi:hypothetical protein
VVFVAGYCGDRLGLEVVHMPPVYASLRLGIVWETRPHYVYEPVRQRSHVPTDIDDVHGCDFLRERAQRHAPIQVRCASACNVVLLISGYPWLGRDYPDTRGRRCRRWPGATLDIDRSPDRWGTKLGQPLYFFPCLYPWRPR